MKRLVIIDGKSVFYRGFYAMKGLTTSDGTPTGGVYGFASLALEVIKKLNPDYVAVAWDKKGTSISRRLEIFDGYKAGRKAQPEEFYAQFPLLRELLSAFGWPLLECDGYEADDILGTLARQANEVGVEACLITSDLDMLQLIDQNTKVFAMKKGFSNIEEFDLEYFEQKYGLKQSQFLDLKALQGDSSDNIPGVAGIGPKTATSLLQEFFTLENIFENLDKIKPAWRKKLEAGRESAFMSKKIAEIWLDAPVEFDAEKFSTANFNYPRVLEILRKFEMPSLILKIPAHLKENANDSAQGSLFDCGDNFETTQKMPDFSKEDLAGFFDAEQFLAEGGDLARCEIFWDAKADFHALKNAGIEPDFGQIYDIRQMEFLLNPLIRDKSLAGVLAQIGDFDFDEKSPQHRKIAMKMIFENQQKRLESLPKIAKVANELDFPLSKVLYKMERAGVKIDREFFADLSEDFAQKIAKVEAEIFEIAGEDFNPASPLQLSRVLFETLELPTKGIKKSRNGFSTGQKELDKLRGLSPIIEKIEEFRELSKLKNTYIDALPKLADEAGRIHSTFNQDVTTTGRLSSTNPNMQNIPIRSEMGRKIRRGFVADEGKILVAADYSQFELRLAGVMAGDQSLIEDFKSGADIHVKTASQMFKIPESEVSSDQRRAAKAINFGILYGMSAHRLAGELGTTIAEARGFIDNYFEIRKPIADYISKTIEQAEVEGFVETMLGRRRPTPDVKSASFMVREAAKRAATNMPIQGTEADLMKRAMLAIDHEVVEAGLGEQILQIHDSILIETPVENAEKVAKILKREMESVAPELDIPLKVDVKIGANWEEL